VTGTTFLSTSAEVSAVTFNLAAHRRLILRPEYYLSIATNEMYSSLLKVNDSTVQLAAEDRSNLMHAADVGCRALGFLVSDQEFKADLAQMSQQVVSRQEAITAILGEPEQPGTSSQSNEPSWRALEWTSLSSMCSLMNVSMYSMQSLEASWIPISSLKR